MKQILLLLVLVLVTSFLVSGMITASAQSAVTKNCTASRPCFNICGDHVCAPGELAQMKAQSAQSQRNNSGTSITPSTTTPPTGVEIGKVIFYMDIASDGTAVLVRTGHPIMGQPLAIITGFTDANGNFVQNQNYAITVTQDGNTMLSNPAGYARSGTDSQTTSALSSNNPVNVMITLNGVGLPTADQSTWIGVKGQVLDFLQVTDVQTPTTMLSNMTISNMTMPAGNSSVPEFGPVASIVLTIAVISTVVFTARTRILKL